MHFYVWVLTEQEMGSSLIDIYMESERIATRYAWDNRSSSPDHWPGLKNDYAINGAEGGRWQGAIHEALGKPRDIVDDVERAGDLAVVIRSNPARAPYAVISEEEQAINESDEEWSRWLKDLNARDCPDVSHGMSSLIDLLESRPNAAVVSMDWHS